MKKRRFPNDGSILPQFTMDARFCYFVDLFTSSAEINNQGGLPKHKRELFFQAKNALTTPIRNQLDSKRSLEKIKNAVDFLNAVARSEREKELRVIKKYIQDIENNPFIQKLIQGKNKDVLDLLKELENYSNNPKSMNPQDFYTKLMILINSVRSEIEYTKERLNQILSKNRTNWSKIAEDFIPFRLGGDIDTLMKAAQGIQERTKKDSLSRLIIDHLIKFIKNGLKNNIIFIQYPMETLIGLMIDFEKYFQPYYKHFNEATTEKDKKRLIDEVWAEYERAQTRFLTALQNETREAQEIIDTIRMQIGIREMDKVGEAYETRQELIQKQLTSKTRDKRNQLNTLLTKTLGNNPNSEFSQYFSWTVTTGRNGQHGRIYEILPTVLERAFKVKGSPATDILVPDVAKLKIEFQDEVVDKTRDIKQAIEKGTIQIRKEATEDLSDNYKEMNKQITAATNAITKILQDNKIPEDVFIYHESLKLYARVEEHQTRAFEGRELVILNALDNLYTANGFNGLELIDKNLLTQVALNLSSLAVGGGIKGLVENYLSIFAGLLMFDDIENIAADAAKNAALTVETAGGQAFNVHLYLLNDFYVPGSLLMTSIAHALEQGYNKIIEASDGAKVVINTNDADKAISEYLAARRSGTSYDINDWNSIATSVASGTKMQIIFLTSFFSFLEDMQNYLQ